MLTVVFLVILLYKNCELKTKITNVRKGLHVIKTNNFKRICLARA